MFHILAPKIGVRSRLALLPATKLVSIHPLVEVEKLAFGIGQAFDNAGTTRIIIHVFTAAASYMVRYLIHVVSELLL
jgi:hypothetical protein|tara:strand:- start:959 stop:1189 length:231 start_codon:yes stop_codon:yes gene_type:complete